MPHNITVFRSLDDCSVEQGLPPALQLVQVVGKVGNSLFQPLPLAGFRDDGPWLCGGVMGVTWQDLPVVKYALGEGLATGV